jgi:hypothetical protein
MSTQSTTTTGQAVSGLGRDWLPFRHIPGPDGLAYKSESRRDGEQPGTLERWTVWHKPDPRKDKPHTHPWPFVSHIVSGGLLVALYHLDPDTLRWSFVGDIGYRAGDFMPVGEYDAHIVTKVLPGTVTHMLIGPLFAGPQDWGHVNLLTHALEPAKASPEFLQALGELNARIPEVSEEFRAAFRLLVAPPGALLT